MTDLQSRRWLVNTVLCLSCVLLLSAGPALAQLSSAALTGVVHDATGAVVANASVVLHNVDTGIDFPSSTNDTGNYRFTNITPSRYTLKVSAASFTTKQVAEFILAVNQTATIDVSLVPGATTEVVNVEATTEQLQASTAELGTVIATKQVNDLPLNGRNFTQLLSLTPGVSPISVGQNAMSGRTGGFAAPIAEGAAFSFPSINGATNRSNYFLTDGMNNFAAFLSTYAVPPIVDAIQEFKVVSHTDSAEFGSVLGGVVNVVTKSGTDHFHGAAWEYLRNDAFDSRTHFLPADKKKPAFRQNQFGASIGGPVALPTLKKNTFFYFAYQGFRYSLPNTENILVPTDKQLGGDFSDLCTAGFTAGVCNNSTQQIYNPFTTTASGSGFTRQPFLNNQIPTNLIDSRLVGFVQTVYPRAGTYNPQTNSNAFDSDPNTQHQNEYNVKIDHTFGQKDSVWFRYSRFASSFSGTSGWLIPSLGLQNGFVNGGEIIQNTPQATDNHEVSVTLTKVKGNHTFGSGASYISSVFASPISYDQLGFSTAQTSDAKGNGGFSLASYLLGVPDSANRRNVNEKTRPGGLFSAFFQDSWKASSKLTVNYGIRYDLTLIPPYGTKDTFGQQGGIETGEPNYSDGTYVLQYPPPPCSVRGVAPCIPSIMLDASGNAV